MNTCGYLCDGYVKVLVRFPKSHQNSFALGYPLSVEVLCSRSLDLFYSYPLNNNERFFALKKTTKENFSADTMIYELIRNGL